MNTSNSYFPGLDLLKVFGLYLMILGHGGITGYDMHCYIYSFHMPLFITISGFLFKMRTPHETAIRGFNSLIVPYFMVNAICFTIDIAYTSIKGGLSLDYFTNTIIAILTGLGYTYGSYHPVCTPMWFFYTLFLVQYLVSFFGRWSTNGLIILMLTSFAFTLTMMCNNYDTMIPIDSAFMSIPFFLIGYWFKNYLLKIVQNESRCTYMLVFSIPILLFCGHYNGLADLNTCNPGRSILLYYIVAITLSVVLIMLSLRAKVPAWGGVKTLSIGAPIIVGFNLLTLSLVNHYRIGIPWNDVCGIFAAFLVLMSYYPLILFVKNKMPIILGYRNTRD